MSDPTDTLPAETPETGEREATYHTPTVPPPRRSSAGDGPPRGGASLANGLPEQLPVSWREPVAILLLVVLFDVTVYRTLGLFGPVAWLAFAPLLLAAGAPRWRAGGVALLLALMIWMLAARTAWQGSVATVIAGFMLLVGFALTLSGRRPYVPSVVVHFATTTVAGPLGLWHYLHSLGGRRSNAKPGDNMLNVVLPLGAVILFGTIFILANPDLVSGVAQFARQYSQWLVDSLENMVPHGGEIVLWVVVALVVIGLYRPVVPDGPWEPAHRQPSSGAVDGKSEASLYPAFRNTLIALIVLFVVYLVFEFQTLWFREFPEGFYYAGYAHEGAAWLTAALALATVVLSIVFRGQTLRDHRLRHLRRLAWIWSALNLVLAAAVYNRMYIYIDFNGMTRMRTIGLLGISCVLVGFMLVIRMIISQRSFAWLVQRQLWTLSLFVILYLLLPVDMLIHRFNVQRVLAGDLAPVVQITEHPVSSEGVLMLPPLLQSEDRLIREGIRALLAERFVQLNEQAAIRHQQDWTAYQHADQLLLDELDSIRDQWEVYADEDRRNAVLKEFREYAYQWY